MIGLDIPKRIGIGDAVQFTNIPENYFHYTGEKMWDLNSHWVFDYNPYVLREGRDGIPFRSDMQLVNPWDAHCSKPINVFKNRTTFISNAESHSRSFGDYPIVLNRPRLYRFEDLPFYQRNDIILHVKGVSNGPMPEHVVEHIMKKYERCSILRIGHKDDWVYNLPAPIFVSTNNMWDLAAVISEACMFIGVDSGPSWIAQCYPDVVVKKVRLKPDVKRLKTWVPLECSNLHSHWDDRAAQHFNPSEEDVSFTWSYKKI